MALPNDILDIVLSYTGKYRLLCLSKNKEKLKFYNRIDNCIKVIEKKVIRYLIYKGPYPLGDKYLHINGNILFRSTITGYYQLCTINDNKHIAIFSRNRV